MPVGRSGAIPRGSLHPQGNPRFRHRMLLAAWVRRRARLAGQVLPLAAVPRPVESDRRFGQGGSKGIPGFADSRSACRSTGLTPGSKGRNSSQIDGTGGSPGGKDGPSNAVWPSSSCTGVSSRLRAGSPTNRTGEDTGSGSTESSSPRNGSAISWRTRSQTLANAIHRKYMLIFLYRSTSRALGRTSAFYADINAHYRKLREASSHYIRSAKSERAKQITGRVKEVVEEIAKHLDSTLLPAFERPLDLDVRPIPAASIGTSCRALVEVLRETAEDLHRLAQESRASSGVTERYSQEQSDLEGDWNSCWHALLAARGLNEFLAGPDLELANRPAFLVSGVAGQGKTHLLCDVTRRDMASGRPRILLHGLHFTDAEPWGQIVSMLHLACTPEEFLGAPRIRRTSIWLSHRDHDRRPQRGRRQGAVEETPGCHGRPGCPSPITRDRAECAIDLRGVGNPAEARS